MFCLVSAVAKASRQRFELDSKDRAACAPLLLGSSSLDCQDLGDFSLWQDWVLKSSETCEGPDVTCQAWHLRHVISCTGPQHVQLDCDNLQTSTKSSKPPLNASCVSQLFLDQFGTASLMPVVNASMPEASTVAVHPGFSKAPATSCNHRPFIKPSLAKQSMLATYESFVGTSQGTSTRLGAQTRQRRRHQARFLSNGLLD